MDDDAKISLDMMSVTIQTSHTRTDTVGSNLFDDNHVPSTRVQSPFVSARRVRTGRICRWTSWGVSDVTVARDRINIVRRATRSGHTTKGLWWKNGVPETFTLFDIK